jgi:hypothetical protein
MRIQRRVVLNFIVFQVAWLACVLGGANDQAAAGTLAVLVAIGLHLAIASRPRPEALLVAAAGLVGLAWDSGVVALGLMSYPAGQFAQGLAPYWIVAMWGLFATTLNLSMSWLRGRPWLAALLGAFGGPLAYLAGARLGGLQMPDPVLALGVQALGWAVLLPVLNRLAEQLDGFGQTTSPAWKVVQQEAHGNA